MELELSAKQIWDMIIFQQRININNSFINIYASDSYGPHMHRTWVFVTEKGEAIGSIERYWGGLKMICSVLGGSPRTSFFTEDGNRTTNKGLKGL